MCFHLLYNLFNYQQLQLDFSGMEFPVTIDKIGKI